MGSVVSQEEKEKIFIEYKAKTEVIKKRMYHTLLEISRKIDDEAYGNILKKLEKEKYE